MRSVADPTEIDMTPTLMHETAAALAAVTAEAELGALQAQVKALMQAIAYVDAEAPRLEKQACVAWKRKDQRALTHARSVLVEWLMVRDEVAMLNGRVEAHRRARPDADRQRNAALQRMVDDLERAGASLQRLDEAVRVLVALGDVPKEPRRGAPRPHTFKASLCDLFKLPFADTMPLANV